MDRLETDVLVVGAGLAGLRAAVAAREAGARVKMVVKGKAGRSGASAMTTAGYAAVLAGALDDTVERHVADTMKGGGGIGERTLIEALCTGAADGVAYLEMLGTRFERDGAAFRISPSGDHSRSRVIVTENHIGTDATIPLTTRAEELGVEAMEFAMAVDLLTDAEGRVGGALCLATRSGETFAINAGATVLATGGAGRLFPLSSNPNDLTGDAFALGARAGALLRDMEFIQFYPWRCIKPFASTRVSVQPSTFSMGGRLYNASGERFMVAFNPDGAEATSRDVAARGIFNEMRKGCGVGGGVRLDMSQISGDDFARFNPKIARYCEKKGIDHRTYPFIVTPEAHYWLGGLVVDGDGATSIDGLWCAGEAAGGIHGANRINSNALPETLIFGARAGAAAADASRRRRVDIVAPPRPVSTGMDAVDADQALARLRGIAWTHLGIIRDGPGMAAGVRSLASLKDEIAERGAADPKTMRAVHELGFLCETTELSLTAAIARTESRGSHFREDYPATDARWAGSVIVAREDESTRVVETPMTRPVHA